WRSKVAAGARAGLDTLIRRARVAELAVGDGCRLRYSHAEKLSIASPQSILPRGRLDLTFFSPIRLTGIERLDQGFDPPHVGKGIDHDEDVLAGQRRKMTLLGEQRAQNRHELCRRYAL